MNVVGGCYMDLSLNQSPYVQAGILITGPSIITYISPLQASSLVAIFYFVAKYLPGSKFSVYALGYGNELYIHFE